MADASFGAIVSEISSLFLSHLIKFSRPQMRRRPQRLGQIRPRPPEKGQTAIGAGRKHGRAARRVSRERDETFSREALRGDEDARLHAHRQQAIRICDSSTRINTSPQPSQHGESREWRQPKAQRRHRETFIVGRHHQTRCDDAQQEQKSGADFEVIVRESRHSPPQDIKPQQVPFPVEKSITIKVRRQIGEDPSIEVAGSSNGGACAGQERSTLPQQLPAHETLRPQKERPSVAETLSWKCPAACTFAQLITGRGRVQQAMPRLRRERLLHAWRDVSLGPWR